MSLDTNTNIKYESVWLRCKLENEILKEAKNLEKWPKMITLRPKNVIFERFWPVSKFYFPACSTLSMMLIIRTVHFFEKFDSWLTPGLPVTWHIQLCLSHLFRGHGRPRIWFHEKHTGPTYTVTRDASMFRTRNQIRGAVSPKQVGKAQLDMLSINTLGISCKMNFGGLLYGCFFLGVINCAESDSGVKTIKFLRYDLSKPVLT